MYFAITGNDKNDDFGTCEIIVEAESKETAKRQAEKFGIVCESVAEISIEELIEKEKDELVERAFQSYLMRNGDISVREYSEAQKKLKQDPKEQYAAMKYFNCKVNFIDKVQTKSSFRNDLPFCETMRTIEQIAIANMQEDLDAFDKAVGKIKKSK